MIASTIINWCYQSGSSSPRLNHEEIENLNRSITSKEIESETKTFLTMKKPWARFTGEFYQTCKELTPILLRIFQKLKTEEHFLAHSIMWDNSLPDVQFTDSIDRNLSKLWEIVEDKGTWHTTVHGFAESRTWLSDWRTITNSKILQEKKTRNQNPKQYISKQNSTTY